MSVRKERTMSRPGDPGRRQIVAEGFDAIVTRAVELIGTVPGASAFELKYDARDRQLAEDEEPGPDEAVVWTASGGLRRKYVRGGRPITRTVTGTAVVEPGGGHAQGIVNAVVDLLEQLGANVVMLTGAGE